MYEEIVAPSTISLKLRTNTFKKDGYIANVSRNTINLNHLVTGICNKHSGLDPYVINHAAELLKQEIREELHNGKAVNVLELGTLYLAPVDSISTLNPKLEDMPKVAPKFTVSKDLVSYCKDLTAESFMISDSAPQISKIICLRDGNADGNLYPKFPVRLTGDHLKLDDSASSGIFMVPVDENEEADTDESKWIKVDTSFLPRNTNGTLEFFCPDLPDDGTKFRIAVRSSYVNGTSKRKFPLTGMSIGTVKGTF